MKTEKVVTMVCPSCKAEFEPEPIIMIQKDGSTRMELHLKKTCKYCGKGLVRRVEKHAVDKGPGAAP